MRRGVVFVILVLASLLVWWVAIWVLGAPIAVGLAAGLATQALVAYLVRDFVEER